MFDRISNKNEEISMDKQEFYSRHQDSIQEAQRRVMSDLPDYELLNFDSPNMV